MVSDVAPPTASRKAPSALLRPKQGPDLQLQKMLQGAGRMEGAPKPVLEINPAIT